MAGWLDLVGQHDPDVRDDAHGLGNLGQVLIVLPSHLGDNAVDQLVGYLFGAPQRRGCLCDKPVGVRRAGVAQQPDDGESLVEPNLALERGANPLVECRVGGAHEGVFFLLVE